MVVGKILIDLRQFWPHGKCLLKRHLPQFSKSWYIFKTTILENWIYIKGVSWKDTFHVAKNPICIKGVSSQFDKFECLMNLILKLKMSFETHLLRPTLGHYLTFGHAVVVKLITATIRYSCTIYNDTRW